MNFERVIFGFVVILALSFNVAFVIGDVDDIQHHSAWLLTIAIIINLIATLLKLGDRSQIGALILAGSLVTDVLLIAARVIWVVADNQTPLGPDPESTVTIVSLGYGALAAGIVTTVILISEALMARR